MKTSVVVSWLFIFGFLSALAWGVIGLSENIGVLPASLVGGFIYTTVVYRAMRIQVKTDKERMRE